MTKFYSVLFIFIFITCEISVAQNREINWSNDGLFFFKIEDGNLIKVDPRKNDTKTIVIKKEQLTPSGTTTNLTPEKYSFSVDNTKFIFLTNSAKVWRYNTRGDYWVLDITKNKLHQLGKDLPSQSLMFAKISPDGKNAAYVSGHNIYAEDLNSGTVKKLTFDGTRKLINGTFDWVYEEEFGCRDGFRWSPDSKSIAYWQVDASKTRDYYMLNTTDSVYSNVIPVEYPKVGEAPSSVKVGVVSLMNAVTKWMKIEGDPRQHYITRMEWSDANELIVQQLDRKQQESRLIYCNAYDGSSRTFWAENDDAWVDLNTDNPMGWNWINNHQDFLWVSEKDGWRHIYKISKDGKTTTLLTKGDYDIGKLEAIDEVNNYIYFSASPENATQLYLYRSRINNNLKTTIDAPAELVSDKELKGTHEYQISPNGKLALHQFSNHNTPSVAEWLTFPENKPVAVEKSIAKNINTDASLNVEYIKIKTVDNIILDAWINRPKNFNPDKKYPMVVYVYGEPAAATVADSYGNHDNFLYNGSMAEDGYIQVGIDNRGTPSLRGAAWRKAIYRRNGQVNIRDMAMGIKKISELPYIDKDRIAVWGWSGGGSSTLHLLFRFPDLFKTGIAIAPVSNLLYYDNIYTERYMGLPQENLEDFEKGSALNYASGLKGNLLLIHGSGDDNVHYSNAEALVNELIKYNKQFQFMEYPNRTHNISEGPGTWQHLSTLYTNYIRANCLPGGK
jgi:dipeptidyl-peptidase-4